MELQNPEYKRNPPCCTHCERILWEEDNISHDGRLIGWFTIWYVAPTHPHSGGLTFRVTYDDIVAKNTLPSPEPFRAAWWRHDLTDTPLGQNLLAGYRASHPEDVAKLPNNITDLIIQDANYPGVTKERIAAWCSKQATQPWDMSSDCPKAMLRSDFRKLHTNRFLRRSPENVVPIDPSSQIEADDEVWKRL